MPLDGLVCVIHQLRMHFVPSYIPDARTSPDENPKSTHLSHEYRSLVVFSIDASVHFLPGFDAFTAGSHTWLSPLVAITLPLNSFVWCSYVLLINHPNHGVLDKFAISYCPPAELSGLGLLYIIADSTLPSYTTTLVMCKSQNIRPVLLFVLLLGIIAREHHVPRLCKCETRMILTLLILVAADTLTGDTIRLPSISFIAWTWRSTVARSRAVCR